MLIRRQLFIEQAEGRIGPSHKISRSGVESFGKRYDFLLRNINFAGLDLSDHGSIFVAQLLSEVRLRHVFGDSEVSDAIID